MLEESNKDGSVKVITAGATNPRSSRNTLMMWCYPSLCADGRPRGKGETRRSNFLAKRSLNLSLPKTQALLVASLMAPRSRRTTD